MVDRSAIASDISSPTNDVYKRSPLFHPSQPPLPSSRCSFPGYLFTVERAGLLGRIRTILDAGPPSPRPPLPSPLSPSLSLSFLSAATVKASPLCRRWSATTTMHRIVLVGERRWIYVCAYDEEIAGRRSLLIAGSRKFIGTVNRHGTVLLGTL